MCDDCLKEFSMQGGTCVLVGDTPSRVAEAAKYAKELIGCDIMESQPYFSQEGHVQVCHHSHMNQRMGAPFPSTPQGAYSAQSQWTDCSHILLARGQTAA